ncbi:hypothetical protein ZHAS_00005675 [Anopheles sinensis]|uniref:Zf-C3Hc3H domain-containing protein n=1 Tax=Anopheles sinensis TaxID=74873 RepID=A0A084VK26_ANOSI|nr:hypothetical protein ZHAS_00005675 [Anopheles sinensis]
MTGVANGSLLVKVNSSGPVVGAINTTGVSKTAASLDNQASPQARRSSGQQSLLIGAATEKSLSQQQTLVTNSAAAADSTTLSRSPLSVMKSEANKEIAASPTDHVIGSLNEPRNGGGKIKQQSGRKSVTKATAKQPKAGKRTYTQRLQEERQGKPKCALLPPTTSLVMSPGVPNAAASAPEPESFQAAFAKMARPTAPEAAYRGGVECKSASSSMPTPKSTKVKKESARKLFGADGNQQDGGEMKPVKLKFVAPKVPGAVAVPITRPKVKEWHAPGAYMFDLKDPGDESDDDVYEERPNTLSFWYEESIAITTVPDSTTGWGMNPRHSVGGMRAGRNNKQADSLQDVKFQIRMLTRDERLELKKAYLQRRVVQCRNGLRMRHISTAKRKLESMATLIKRLDKRRLQAMNQESEKPKCIHEGCDQPALVMTSHCYNHITENKEQRLFQRCTAKFADNSQCRQPVFDISHELVLCKEHAWKHDNHDKMSQEVRSQKKSPSMAAAVSAATAMTAGTPTSLNLVASRKKIKPAPPVVVVRPQKRPKKKKKLRQFVANGGGMVGSVQVKQQQSHTMALHQNVPLSNGVQHIPMMNADDGQTHGIIGSTDLLTICENSSAYASSEDTGVGGLSESELMATQEVIEEIIPFEIGNLLNTNVLSQLAPDALNELLFASGDQEEHDAGAAFEGTTREVEDDIERALEHVKSLDDMAVESANFLGDFLENVDDEMLDGADICSNEQMLQSPNNANDIRGLVHT